MDDNKQDKAGALPGGDGCKRKPPTIDLAATDVTESPRVSDAPETPGATASAAADSESAAETSGESTADPASESSAESSPSPSRASSVVFSAIMSAILGGVVALLVLGGAKFAGLLDPPPPVTATATKSDVDALGTRIAKIETDVAKPVPAPRPVTDPAIVARLDSVEKSLASLRGDVAAVRGQGEKVAAAISEIKSAPPQGVIAVAPQAAPAIDTSAIEERLGKIERATAALSAASAAPVPQPPAEDPKVRRLDALLQLDKAMRYGGPYASELAAARSVAGDSDALRSLAPFANTGIPDADTLSKELLALLPQLAPKPAAQPAPSGIIERLQQSLAKLVRIQRTDAAASGAAGIIARATAAAQRSDPNEAKRELLLLPAPDRVVVRPWIAKVEGRDKALAASEQFTMDTLTAISK